MSEQIQLPEGVSIYINGRLCDMAIGSCACGAWHDATEAVEYFARLVRDAQAAIATLEIKKSLGQVAYEAMAKRHSWPYQWAGPEVTDRVRVGWEESAAAVVAEHERRKR
jgi:hypothetical protein